MKKLIFLSVGLVLITTGCNKEKIYGCLDSSSPNYNPEARYSDDSCQGCTDPQALNFNPSSDIDNGSCEYDVYGCPDSLAYNYNPEVTIDNDSCVYGGCLDPQALNYNFEMDVDDGSCIYGEGCNNQTSINYNSDVYNLVVIGGKCWFKENLKTLKYSNGVNIPIKTSNSNWTSTTEGVRCAYNNSASNITQYGYLYNWYAVTDPRGLCPVGFHVSTDNDWVQLEQFLGLTNEEIYLSVWRGNFQGNFLKAEEEGGTNETNFTGLLGGERFTNGEYSQGENSGYWWTSTQSIPNPTSAWVRVLNNTEPGIGRGDYESFKAGRSVRCVKD